MPLSTLQATSHDAACKTEGQDGVAVSFLVGLFHSLQHAGLSRRTLITRKPDIGPKALDDVRLCELTRHLKAIECMGVQTRLTLIIEVEVESWCQDSAISLIHLFLVAGVFGRDKYAKAQTEACDLILYQLDGNFP